MLLIVFTIFLILLIIIVYYYTVAQVVIINNEQLNNAQLAYLQTYNYKVTKNKDAGFYHAHLYQDIPHQSLEHYLKIAERAPTILVQRDGLPIVLIKHYQSTQEKAFLIEDNSLCLQSFYPSKKAIYWGRPIIPNQIYYYSKTLLCTSTILHNRTQLLTLNPTCSLQVYTKQSINDFLTKKYETVNKKQLYLYLLYARGGIYCDNRIFWVQSISNLLYIYDCIVLLDEDNQVLPYFLAVSKKNYITASLVNNSIPDYKNTYILRYGNNKIYDKEFTYAYLR